MVVAVIGVFTAIFAATIGLVQNDIKKVLAYSTISQLGYMFLAMGAGAFSAGIFHVMTHAFFKALLFLGAGSVIHSMHEEQDIRKYGGLKKYMPVTYGTFLIAAVAISGIPPLSGFFSKDEILWFSFTNIGFIVWLVGVITALFTAFYMFRLYFMTFEGKEKFRPTPHPPSQVRGSSHSPFPLGRDGDRLPHESPKMMTIPLIVLAILSVIGGFIGIPEIFSGEHGNLFHNWLAPVFISAERKLLNFGSHSHFEELLLMTISVAGAVAAIFLARHIYLRKPEIAAKFSTRMKGTYNLLLNKYFVDEIYDATIVNPIVKGSENFLWKIADNKLIDGFVNSTAAVIQDAGQKLRRIQTGIAQSYALIMVVGILLAIMWIILSV